MFFAMAIISNGEPAEVTTDRAHALVRVIAHHLPAALHDTTQYANNEEERHRHVSLTNASECSGPVSENGQSVSGEIPLGTLASRHGQYQ
jgi:transposase-like protein